MTNVEWATSQNDYNRLCLVNTVNAVYIPLIHDSFRSLKAQRYYLMRSVGQCLHL